MNSKNLFHIFFLVTSRFKTNASFCSNYATTGFLNQCDSKECEIKYLDSEATAKKSSTQCKPGKCDGSSFQIMRSIQLSNKPIAEFSTFTKNLKKVDNIFQLDSNNSPNYNILSSIP